MQRQRLHKPTAFARGQRVHRLGTRVRAGVRREDGVALIEFALVLPILLLVIFGIIQFGLALNAANDQTHVANEVARYAIVNEDPGANGETLQQWGKKQGYTNYTNELNSEGKLCISFPRNEATGTSEQIGDPVKVDFTSTTNWLPVLKLSATSTEIKGSAEMRLEAKPTYAAGCA